MSQGVRIAGTEHTNRFPRVGEKIQAGATEGAAISLRGFDFHFRRRDIHFDAMRHLGYSRLLDHSATRAASPTSTAPRPSSQNAAAAPGCRGRCPRPHSACRSRPHLAAQSGSSTAMHSTRCSAAASAPSRSNDPNPPTWACCPLTSSGAAVVECPCWLPRRTACSRRDGWC